MYVSAYASVFGGGEEVLGEKGVWSGVEGGGWGLGDCAYGEKAVWGSVMGHGWI